MRIQRTAMITKAILLDSIRFRNQYPRDARILFANNELYTKLPKLLANSFSKFASSSIQEIHEPNKTNLEKIIKRLKDAKDDGFKFDLLFVDDIDEDINLELVETIKKEDLCSAVVIYCGLRKPNADLLLSKGFCAISNFELRADTSQVDIRIIDALGDKGLEELQKI